MLPLPPKARRDSKPELIGPRTGQCNRNAVRGSRASRLGLDPCATVHPLSATLATIVATLIIPHRVRCVVFIAIVVVGGAQERCQRKSDSAPTRWRNHWRVLEELSETRTTV